MQDRTDQACIALYSYSYLSNCFSPKTTLKYIKGVIFDFFRGWDQNRKKYHWASWETLGYPLDEGDGIGVRNLNDVCIAFQYKQ